MSSSVSDVIWIGSFIGVFYASSSNLGGVVLGVLGGVVFSNSDTSVFLIFVGVLICLCFWDDFVADGDLDLVGVSFLLLF